MQHYAKFQLLFFFSLSQAKQVIIFLSSFMQHYAKSQLFYLSLSYKQANLQWETYVAT